MSTVQIARWHTLDTWSPRISQVNHASWPMRALGEVLTEAQIEPHRPSPEEVVRFAGVRWYGNGLFVREERPGAAVKGRCFPLEPGLLVYNRLFAWKSAFAVVPASMRGVVVSNEFPQFRVDESEADPEFVRLVCTSEPFAAAVAGRSTGTTAVSRNRLRQTDFLSLTIPLPPLNTQAALVAEHERRTSEADTLTRAAQARRAEGWATFEEALGVASSAPMPLASSVSIAQFSSLSRWDGAPSSAADMTLRWPVVPLETHADIRLGCQVPRRGSRGPGNEHPYLRAANVQRGFLDLSDVKKMRVADGQAQSLQLLKDDILFVEGSGSAQEVGRCAIWDGPSDGVIHQNSVIRARTDDILDARFACAWFNSNAGGAYFREQATTTSGLFHIGAGKTAQAPVPVPPPDVQKDLANALWAALDAAADGEERAAAERNGAKQGFAQSVYGSLE